MGQGSCFGVTAGGGFCPDSIFAGKCAVIIMSKERILQEDYKKLNEIIVDLMLENDQQAAISGLLEKVGALFRSERMYIFEINPRGNADNTYEWCADGAASYRSSLQDVPVSRSFRKILLEKQVVLLPDPALFGSQEPMVEEILLFRKTDRMILAPIVHNREMTGFFGVDNTPEDDSEILSSLIRKLIPVITSILYLRNNVERLRVSLGYESVLNHAALRALGQRDPEQSIRTFLGIVGEQVGATRACICESRQYGGISVTYAWGDGTRTGRRAEWISGEIYRKYWKPRLMDQHIILVRDTDVYAREHPEEGRILFERGVRRCVVLPVFVEEYRGFVCFENVRTDAVNRTMSLFEVAAAFIGALLRHRDNDRNIRQVSFRDDLTEAMNRHALNHMVDRLSKDQSVGMIFCDINGLKEVNDSKGHLAGDQLIIRTSEILLRHVPWKQFSNVFRMGGDEFLLLMSDMDSASFRRLVDEVRLDFRRENLSVSLGAIWNTDVRDGLGPLLEEADHAMYEEKKRWHEEHRHYMLSSRNINLQECLMNGEFFVCMQPRVSLEQGRVISGEALIRWEHQGRMMEPDSFLPEMEENGFLVTLDSWVWKQVFLMQRELLDQGVEPVPAVLNTSVPGFLERNYLERLAALRRKYRLPGNLFHIEIRYGDYVKEKRAMDRMIEGLHREGFRVLLDHFGERNVPGIELREVKADALTLDPARFQQEALMDPDLSIVDEQIAISHIQGKYVCVVGIETPEQAERLRKIECHYGQGNYFYRPVPLKHFVRLIRTEGVVDDGKYRIYRERISMLNIRNAVDEGLLTNRLLNHVLGAAAIYERQGNRIRILQINQAYSELMGLSIHDGKPDPGTLDRINESLSGMLYGMMRAEEDPENGWGTPFSVIRPDGKHLDLYVRIFRIFGDRDRTFYFVLLHEYVVGNPKRQP